MTTAMGRDIVLFLGAGFSKDAGLPIMSAFGPESLKDYEGLKKHTLEDNFKNAAPMLVEAAKAFYAFQDLCRHSPILKSDDVDNLETVFCIAEAMNESGLVNIPLQGVLYKPEVLIQKIQLWLWKIYQQCPFLDPTRKKETREETYTDFFQVLKQAGIWKRTTVISTNYDLIFEYMFLKNGVCCAYPFKEISADIRTINAGHGLIPYVYDNQYDPEVDTVLCKLHGSVNFFEDESNINNHTLFIATDLGDVKPIGESYNFNGKPAIFAVDAIWKIQQEHGHLIPAIIPPTYAKLARKPWLREIWRHAFDAIRNAKAIIFIGYSMTPSDGFMRALIHGAFATGKDISSRNIFVIDPSPKVHDNYSKLFGAIYRDIGCHTLEWALTTNILKGILEVATKKEDDSDQNLPI